MNYGAPGIGLDKQREIFETIITTALKHGLVVGGPDLKVDHPGLEKRTYPLFRKYKDDGLLVSIDHQWAAFADCRDPRRRYSC